MPDDKDLSRPTVVVNLPKVTLTIQDLAYLRSIGQDKAVRCVASRNVVDRLRFLDLIARAKVPKSADAIAKTKEEMAIKRRALTAAVSASRWDEVANLGYLLNRLQQSLQPVEDDVLTEKGKAILRQGEVMVRVRKVGCV